VTSPEAPEFALILREPDGSERPVVWESVTGQTPNECDEITVDGEPWRVVEQRGDVFICERRIGELAGL
jgi:hypothetical protein